MTQISPIDPTAAFDHHPVVVGNVDIVTWRGAWMCHCQRHHQYKEDVKEDVEEDSKSLIYSKEM